MNKDKTQFDSRWPHRTACLLAATVFPLIWLGNLVTTSDAGMAVPDWPNTYGYNLLLYPWREWFFGPWDLFVEHGHRLLATLAGLISIALVILTYRHEERNWVRLFSLGLLGLVIFQGLLGGFRVLMDARLVAKIHGCLGPAFFAAAVAFCVVTSRGWIDREKWKSKSVQSPRSLAGMVPRLSIIMLSFSYLQLVLGAFVRHIGDAAEPQYFTLLIAGHITMAIAIVLGTLLQFLATRWAVYRGTGIRTSINWLVLLVLAQFCLGLGTWIVKFGWPIWFENQFWAASYVVSEKSFFQINLVTAHAAIGSLILAGWTIHCLRANRAAVDRRQLT